MYERGQELSCPPKSGWVLQAQAGTWQLFCYRQYCLISGSLSKGDGAAWTIIHKKTSSQQSKPFQWIRAGLQTVGRCLPWAGQHQGIWGTPRRASRGKGWGGQAAGQGKHTYFSWISSSAQQSTTASPRLMCCKRSISTCSDTCTSDLFCLSSEAEMPNIRCMQSYAFTRGSV